MTTTKIAIASLIGFLVTFLLGWLFYGVLLSEFFAQNSAGASNVYREEEDYQFWAMILSHLALGVLLAVVIGSWAKVSGFAAGAMVGGTLLFLVSCHYDLIMYGTSNLMNLKSVATDIVVATIIGAIGGACVGWYLGRGTKEVAST